MRPIIIYFILVSTLTAIGNPTNRKGCLQQVEKIAKAADGTATPSTPVANTHATPGKVTPVGEKKGDATQPGEGIDWSKWGLLGAGAAVATTGGALTYWALSTQEYNASVKTLTWSHSYQVQSFNQVTRGNWESNIIPQSPRMPVNGSGERPGMFNIRNCHPKFHHYIQVPDGFRTEIVHTKEGARTRQVQKYRSQPVYRTWCDYDTFAWKNSGNPVTTSGADPTSSDPLPWPNVALGSRERKVATEQYTINVDFDNGGTQTNRDYTANSEQEFLTWRKGDSAIAVINNLGWITDLKHVDLPEWGD